MSMTGQEALEKLRALRALCKAQREALAGAHADVAKVQARADAVDKALAELPPPETLTGVDEAMRKQLHDEARAIADIHRLATYALSQMRTRLAGTTATFRASDRAKAYSDATEPRLGRFIDHHG